MILAVVQARYSSTRLPGKVLEPLGGMPMLAFELQRVMRSRTLDKVVVATSTDSSDDPLVALCANIGVDCYRGSLDDVLGRYRGVAEHYGPDHIVRLTGDCPLIDPAVIDAVVKVHIDGGFDYTSNVDPPTFPDGLDVEVMRAQMLNKAYSCASLPSEREHVTVWIRNHVPYDERGRLLHAPDLSCERWTVDEPRDLEFVRSVCDATLPKNPEFHMEDVLALLADRPELRQVNRGIERNEGLVKSLKEDVKCDEKGQAETDV